MATDELLRTHLSSAVHKTALELAAMKHYATEQVSECVAETIEQDVGRFFGKNI